MVLEGAFVPLTAEERASVNNVFWSHFKDKKMKKSVFSNMTNEALLNKALEYNKESTLGFAYAKDNAAYKAAEEYRKKFLIVKKEVLKRMEQCYNGN